MSNNLQIVTVNCDTRDEDMKDKLFVLVKKVEHQIDKISAPLLSPYGLTGAQLKILMILFQRSNDSVRQVELEKTFSLSNPTVTGILNVMEKQGLILRLPNPEDGRSKIIVPTEETVRRKAEYIALSQAIDEAFRKKLTQNEQDQLTDLLKKMLN